MKRDVVQVRNPRTGRYIKIDRSRGVIVSHKVSDGPYNNIPVVRGNRMNKETDLLARIRRVRTLKGLLSLGKSFADSGHYWQPKEKRLFNARLREFERAA